MSFPKILFLLFFLFPMLLQAQTPIDNFVVDDYTKLNCYDDTLNFCAIGTGESFLQAVMIGLEGLVLEHYHEKIGLDLRKPLKKLKRKQVVPENKRLGLQIGNLSLSFYRSTKRGKIGMLENILTSQLSYTKGDKSFFYTRSHQIINTQLLATKIFDEQKRFTNFEVQDLVRALRDRGFTLQVSTAAKNQSFEVYVKISIEREAFESFEVKE